MRRLFAQEIDELGELEEQTVETLKPEEVKLKSYLPLEEETEEQFRERVEQQPLEEIWRPVGESKQFKTRVSGAKSYFHFYTNISVAKEQINEKGLEENRPLKCTIYNSSSPTEQVMSYIFEELKQKISGTAEQFLSYAEKWYAEDNRGLIRQLVEMTKIGEGQKKKKPMKMLEAFTLQVPSLLAEEILSYIAYQRWKEEGKKYNNRMVSFYVMEDQRPFYAVDLSEGGKLSQNEIRKKLWKIREIKGVGVKALDEEKTRYITSTPIHFTDEEIENGIQDPKTGEMIQVGEKSDAPYDEVQQYSMKTSAGKTVKIQYHGPYNPNYKPTEWSIDKNKHSISDKVVNHILGLHETPFETGGSWFVKEVVEEGKKGRKIGPFSSPREAQQRLLETQKKHPQIKWELNRDPFGTIGYVHQKGGVTPVDLQSFQKGGKYERYGTGHYEWLDLITSEKEGLFKDLIKNDPSFFIGSGSQKQTLDKEKYRERLKEIIQRKLEKDKKTTPVRDETLMDYLDKESFSHQLILKFAQGKDFWTDSRGRIFSSEQELINANSAEWEAADKEVLMKTVVSKLMQWIESEKSKIKREFSQQAIPPEVDEELPELEEDQDEEVPEIEEEKEIIELPELEEKPVAAKFNLRKLTKS